MWRASRLAASRLPAFQPGWPPQVWVAGTSTQQTASSRSLTPATPTPGRISSTRQVTKNATRGPAMENLRNGEGQEDRIQPRMGQGGALRYPVPRGNFLRERPRGIR